MRIRIGNGIRKTFCCPCCGSRFIVGIGQEYCHCGQCGLSMEVTEEEGTVSEVTAEETEAETEFEQLSFPL